MKTQSLLLAVAVFGLAGCATHVTRSAHSPIVAAERVVAAPIATTRVVPANETESYKHAAAAQESASFKVTRLKQSKLDAEALRKRAKKKSEIAEATVIVAKTEEELSLAREELTAAELAVTAILTAGPVTETIVATTYSVNSAAASSTSSSGTHVGPRGGVYTINSKGNKVYESSKGRGKK